MLKQTVESYLFEITRTLKTRAEGKDADRTFFRDLGTAQLQVMQKDLTDALEHDKNIEGLDGFDG